MSESVTLTAARVPTVYFIDDSATMREVIKIAFRKENVEVITCPDAASALAQFDRARPDAVITDVIMPDKDGYEVCEYIKQHGEFAETPVILMSGVVNKTVAERATSVRADELIRKPFHPQDLIGRVKGLLAPKFPSLLSPATVSAGSAAAAGPATAFPAAAPAAKSLTNFFTPQPPLSVRPGLPFAPDAPESRRAAPPASAAPRPHLAPRAPHEPSVAAATTGAGSNSSSVELLRLRHEVRRLELLIKKLQAELEAEHEYCVSLEAHVKTLEGQS